MKKNTSRCTLSKNATYMLWSKSAVLALSLLRMWPEPVRRGCALTLLAVGTLLAGCSQPPRLPSLQPSPTTRPVLTEPVPSVSYSISAQRSIEAWRKKLTGIPPTSKP